MSLSGSFLSPIASYFSPFLHNCAKIIKIIFDLMDIMKLYVFLDLPRGLDVTYLRLTDFNPIFADLLHSSKKKLTTFSRLFIINK